MKKIIITFFTLLGLILIFRKCYSDDIQKDIILIEKAKTIKKGDSIKKVENLLGNNYEKDTSNFIIKYKLSDDSFPRIYISFDSNFLVIEKDIPNISKK